MDLAILSHQPQLWKLCTSLKMESQSPYLNKQLLIAQRPTHMEIKGAMEELIREPSILLEITVYQLNPITAILGMLNTSQVGSATRKVADHTVVPSKILGMLKSHLTMN